MFKILSFICFILILCYHQTLTSDEDVIQLSDRNFKKYLGSSEYLLTMFFLPWSGVCQKYRLHFAAAASILKSKGVPVTLGKMDCSKAGIETCKSKKIDHYPTIAFYKNGTFVKEYKGPLDSHSILKFMTLQFYTNPVEVHCIHQFNMFLKQSYDPVVFGFFEEESALKKMFFKVAREMNESILFGYTSCERLLTRERITDGVLVIKPDSFDSIYEDERVLFRGRTIGQLKDFIVSNYHGLVGHRIPSNTKDFAKPLIILYYSSTQSSFGKEYEYWKRRVIKVAHKYYKYVEFAVSAKDDFLDEVSYFHVNDTDAGKPLIVAIDLEDGKYRMREDLSTKSLDFFVGDFISGRLTPSARTKRLPRENDGYVTIAFNRNFDQLVQKNTKDVLIYMYASLHHRYEKTLVGLRQVADLLQSEDVVIVKMDITSNQIPELFVDKKLPNIFWLPRDTKQLIMYEGDGGTLSLLRFVAHHASSELTNYDRYGNWRKARREIDEL